MHGNKGRELYCISADPLTLAKTANLPLQLPNPPVCFMHLQTSVTLIDTLWNTLKLHFLLKNLTSSQKHRRLAGHNGTEEPQASQNNNLSPPTLPPPHPILYVPLMNEKIKYQSKNKLNFMWQVSFIDYIWVWFGICNNSVMAA